MKKVSMVLLLALVMTAMVLPACSMNPEAELLAARKAFIGTVRAVTVLRTDGAFTKSEGAALSAAAHAGLHALDRWEAQIMLERQEGGIRLIAPRVAIFRDEFRTILHTLTTFQVKGNRAKAPDPKPGG